MHLKNHILKKNYVQIEITKHKYIFLKKCRFFFFKLRKQMQHKHHSPYCRFVRSKLGALGTFYQNTNE